MKPLEVDELRELSQKLARLLKNLGPDRLARVVRGLEPDELVRWQDGPRYFGLAKSRLDEAIKKGLIPPPFPVVEGGRAKAWTGRQILEHQARRLAAANATQKGSR
jgi:predicted DNA-binding transcriptional regulator AlpA